MFRCNTVHKNPISQQTMSLDVSADVTSSESLSFTGLVCIQNQHLTPQKGYAHPMPLPGKASEEFEFSQATTVVRNYYSSERMFPDSHLQLHAIPFVSQPGEFEQISSKLVMPSAQRKNSRVEITESTLDKCTRKPSAKQRNRTDQQRTSGRQSLGQRVFKSFAKPCKDCRTIEPTPSMREQLQRGHVQ